MATLQDIQRAAAAARYAKATPATASGATSLTVAVRKGVVPTDGDESTYVEDDVEIRFLQAAFPTAAAGAVVVIAAGQQHAGSYTLGEKLDATGFTFRFKAKMS